MNKRAKAAAVMLVSLVLSTFPALSVSAAKSTGNPPVKEVKEMLTEEAQDHDIPPEVLKAMAFVETGYKQFDEEGQPIISDDGGIGIMQVTPDHVKQPDLDESRLKTDVAYNIKMGSEILVSKWNKDLPDVNNQQRDVLENWYWPVAAYNGLSEVNDPHRHPNSAYQERVFKRISSRSFLDQDGSYFIMPDFAVKYNDAGQMVFPVGKYKTFKTTPSQQTYAKGDTVYVDGRDGKVNFHLDTVDGSVRTLDHNTKLTITGKPKEEAGAINDFVDYPVQVGDQEGYVASAYLSAKKKDPADFPDVTKSWDYPEAVNYLAERHIITGYEDGSFHPQETVTREQAVRMILKVMGRDFESADVSDPGFSDVKQGSHAFPTVSLGTHIGFVNGKEDHTFNPYGHLKRSHIAKIMVEAFGIEGSSSQEFTDIPDDMWARDYINILTANGIVHGYEDHTFGPWGNMTRAHFSEMLYRYLHE